MVSKLDIENQLKKIIPGDMVTKVINLNQKHYPIQAEDKKLEKSNVMDDTDEFYDDFTQIQDNQSQTYNIEITS